MVSLQPRDLMMMDAVQVLQLQPAVATDLVQCQINVTTLVNVHADLVLVVLNVTAVNPVIGVYLVSDLVIQAVYVSTSILPTCIYIIYLQYIILFIILYSLWMFCFRFC